MNNSGENRLWVWVGGIALLITVVLVGRVFIGEPADRAGEQLYLSNCSGCHGVDGKGFGQLIPPLAGADYLGREAEQLPCIIVHGLEGEIVVNGKTYNQPMAGLGHEALSVSQLQALINYIRNSWGNSAPQLTRQETAGQLDACETIHAEPIP